MGHRKILTAAERRAYQVLARAARRLQEVKQQAEQQRQAAKQQQAMAVQFGQALPKAGRGQA